MAQLQRLLAFVARHRAVVFGLVARAVFWGALVLWCATAIALVGGGPLDVDAMLARFVFGAAACATITVAAAAARVRWMTALVGALHGLGGLGLWLIA
ncbi:MAG TPA: hypothetical protein VG755_16585 [Nannocystaceae bacterium]|nr:hypothetical protein [Nannocystaceae bacterium]